MIRLKKLKSVRRRQSSLREQMWLHGHHAAGISVTPDPSGDSLEPSAETQPASEPVS